METPEQPPRPSLQIGDKTLTAEQVAACVEPACATCHGTGFVRGKKKRRVVCMCLQRNLARQFGDEEDRRRVGASTAEEVALRQMDKREGWKAQKDHILHSRVEALEAQERTLAAEIASIEGAGAAQAEAFKIAIAKTRDTITLVDASDREMGERLRMLREQVRFLEAQIADMHASRVELAATVTRYENDLARVAAQSADAAAPERTELARVQKELDKARRRLATHRAYHGKSKGAVA